MTQRAVGRQAAAEVRSESRECAAAAPAFRCVAFAVVSEQRDGDSAALPLTEVEAVARGVRGAVLSHASDPRAPSLSGHDASGAPLETAHLAVLPVPVAGERVGGSAIGAVIVRVGQADVAGLTALMRWQRSGMRLVLGRLGAWRLIWLDESSAGWNAMEPAIMGPSRTWAPLTPVALDRNPGNLFASDPEKRRAAWAHAEATISEACVRAGLPRPVQVRASSDAASAGVPRAGRFMPYPRDGRKGGRVCVHAAIAFADPVVGPVVVGAGRYFGMGLFAAMAGRPA